MDAPGAVHHGTVYHGTVEEHAAAAVTALQDWYDWQTGLWAAPAGWWNSANALYALIDYMSLTGTGRYLDVVTNTFAKNSGRGFLNDFYDDEGWWALAWIYAHDLVRGQAKKRGFLDMAKALFTDMETGWDPGTCGGGVLWKKGTQGKNSIENELFLAVAARLYQRTEGSERTHYLRWIQRAGAWFYQNFIDVPA